ncbi:GspH/FimT family pseudopilin [Tahibacter amnicola]|uniref:Type II secretion system protein H n=1 Tax=Tahibacter amnicola TaxID=2976241 RepID=A0ABY6BIC1_9GAMM|nr:GspH/FimT family protein [Tahibacter amnicola]UXI69512.1 GspH/FimT family protein [Tahibacter amnicola]
MNAIHRQHGAGLLELVMTLLICAVTLTLAWPQFAGVIADTRMADARNRFTTALAQARLTAQAHAVNVIFCADDGSGQCARSPRWSGSWIHYADRNRNELRDADEPLAGVEPAPATVRVALSDGRQRIRLLRDGSSPGSNTRITFCDARGAAHATALVINNMGRTRRLAAEAAGFALACTP